MLTYEAPIDDMHFLLEAFGYDRVAELEAFEAFDLPTIEMMLERAGRFFSDEVVPTNPVGDREGLEYDTETREVTTPGAFKEAWNQICEHGYIGIATPTAYGGTGGPYTLGTMLTEIATAANKSLWMVAELSAGLTSALLEHGSEAQKTRWLPKLATGEWSATMALTEPQCGTDLGMIRTCAEPEDDGTYTIHGHKIWIGGGEHDLTDNILHFVLARLPDAPEGTDGLSAFVVPKFRPDGSENDLHCSGLAHKMGMHASPTCEMRFEAATGYMVGEPHEGMKAMFVMLNEARRKVGQEGLALSEIAYQTAVAFAKDRRQGRSPHDRRRDEDEPADNILVHPDVRRMLADIKASNEGVRALITWVSVLEDLAHEHPEEETRRESEDIVALLTPVIKAYCTQKGFENVSQAMQITGGAGYTRDLHIEQYLRDLRISMLYGGTNHIQALDLVGRKLPKDDGRLFRTFQSKVTALIRRASEIGALGEMVEALQDASSRLFELTMHVEAKAADDWEQAGAVASTYLTMFGHVAVGYAWLRQLAYAVENDHPLAETKRKTASYFFRMVLPEVESLATVVEEGKKPMMTFDREEF
jgi:alkylation response protein AidB-like acyl-CoA dehydrogenase